MAKQIREAKAERAGTSEGGKNKDKEKQAAAKRLDLTWDYVINAYSHDLLAKASLGVWWVSMYFMYTSTVRVATLPIPQNMRSVMNMRKY